MAKVKRERALIFESAVDPGQGQRRLVLDFAPDPANAEVNLVVLRPQVQPQAENQLWVVDRYNGYIQNVATGEFLTRDPAGGNGLFLAGQTVELEPHQRWNYAAGPTRAGLRGSGQNEPERGTRDTVIVTPMEGWLQKQCLQADANGEPVVLAASPDAEQAPTDDDPQPPLRASPNQSWDVRAVNVK
jgi:hypothetical protein